MAESHADFRHAAFKPNLPGGKAVLDQLLRVIQEESDPKNVDIATEAAMALGKFACPENFNCSEHSKAIIEFNGVPPLMRLLRSGDQAQLQGLVLLCYLALNAGTSKALVQARALNALERDSSICFGSTS
ncbi:ARMADILLO REPEAT ONLY 4 [Salix purpurea]|uniref:ARMADILLO REPEAT ONLY 4 n=1 Tax=Salix purpurea TaxID=77065 RepID=A0A9Q0ZVL3_SALPP|nr:ARMADILLO REPEAT ONLY 4 [Salix purpurea]